MSKQQRLSIRVGTVVRVSDAVTRTMIRVNPTDTFRVLKTFTHHSLCDCEPYKRAHPKRSKTKRDGHYADCSVFRINRIAPDTYSTSVTVKVGKREIVLSDRLLELVN